MVVKILLSWPEKQHVSWFISCGITHDDIWALQLDPKEK